MKKLSIFILLLGILIFFLSIKEMTALKKAFPEIDKGTAKLLSPAIQGGKVIVVLVDRMNLTDLSLENLPGFSQIIEKGVIGLMNCNTAGSNLNPENTYATIGAGAHILAKDTGHLGFNAGEKLENGLAVLEYKRRTGRTAQPSSVIHLGIARIHNQNFNLPYPALPGALGTELHKASLKTAVLGNADTFSRRKRQVITVAMDKYGVVDCGNVGTNILMKDEGFPGGFRTSYDKLLFEFNSLPEDVSLIVIDTGDLDRLEEAYKDSFKDVLKSERNETIKRIDFFIGQLIKQMDLKKDLLLILSPTPGKIAQEKNYLTPVMAFGAGIEKGYLISPSTKRVGIILNKDLAPTVLNFLGLPVPNYINGRPLQVAKADSSFTALQLMYSQLALTYIARPYLLKGYIICQMVLLFICLFCIFLYRNINIRVLQTLLTAILTVPLVFLLLPLLPQPSALVLTMELVMLTFIIAFFAQMIRFRQGISLFIFLGLCSAGLILVDTVLGCPLQKTSIMSYDPIAGARFYGIGNEYIGVLIGSLIVGCTALLNVFTKNRLLVLILIGIIFATSVLIIGIPQLGANMGGFIACSTALLVTFMLLCGFKFNTKNILYLAIVILGLVIFLFVFDLRRPPDLQSHFGRAASLVISGGWPELINIVERKVEMNIKLIKYTIWSRIFLASLGSLALLFYRPVGLVAIIRKSYPDLFRGFIGVIAGSFIALVFNDSGIVAAATTMIFGIWPFIYLVIQEC